MLLSATLDNGVTYDFGNLTNQRTPGVICYDYNSTSCSIKYLSNGQLLISDNISLDKTYQDVPAYKDGPLHGGDPNRHPKSSDVVENRSFEEGPLHGGSFLDIQSL